MAELSDKSALTRHFSKKFTAEKFYEVLYWTKHILNIRKSSALG